MSAGHTSGPWHIRQDEGFQNDVLRPNGRLLATCYPGVDSNGRLSEEGQPEAIANARLIAAAPDILGALLKERDFWLYKSSEGDDRYPPRVCDAHLNNINTALAKAGAA